MRVLIIGEFSEGRLGAYYERAFCQLGITVKRFDTEGPPQNRLMRRATRSLRWLQMQKKCVAAAREGWDSVIAIKAPFLCAESVRAIHKECPRTVMIYPDSPWDAYTQRKDVLSVLSNFRTTFIWSKDLASQLRDCGVWAEYLPFAHDPIDYQAPTLKSAREQSLAFVGQVYKKRIAWIRTLEGLPIKVGGTGWEQRYFGTRSSIRVTNTTQMGRQACDVYTASLGALNVLDEKNLSGHNMRTFEIPATRTLMIGDRTRDIEDWFPDAEASLTAATPGEFREKCEWALLHPEAALQIASRAHARVQTMTYRQRAVQILTYLF
jgi:spore maturation protein CgeB